MEEKLAAILLSKMVNRLDYDRSKVTDADAIVIPVGDVYNAFFKNQIIDTGRFAKSNAGATEKRVLEIYSQNEEAAISSVLSELQNENRNGPTKICLTECRLIWTTWWIHF